MNGRDTSLQDFLDPDILDSLALKTNEVLEVKMCRWTGAASPLFHRCDVQVLTCVSSLLLQKVKQVSPGKPVWLGETSSAYGGGAVGLSDTFVAGFM